MLINFKRQKAKKNNPSLDVYSLTVDTLSEIRMNILIFSIEKKQQQTTINKLMTINVLLFAVFRLDSLHNPFRIEIVDCLFD